MQHVAASLGTAVWTTHPNQSNSASAPNKIEQLICKVFECLQIRWILSRRTSSDTKTSSTMVKRNIGVKHSDSVLPFLLKPLPHIGQALCHFAELYMYQFHPTAQLDSLVIFVVETMIR